MTIPFPARVKSAPGRTKSVGQDETTHGKGTPTLARPPVWRLHDRQFNSSELPNLGAEPQLVALAVQEGADPVTVVVELHGVADRDAARGQVPRQPRRVRNRNGQPRIRRFLRPAARCGERLEQDRQAAQGEADVAVCLEPALETEPAPVERLRPRQVTIVSTSRLVLNWKASGSSISSSSTRSSTEAFMLYLLLPERCPC